MSEANNSANDPTVSEAAAMGQPDWFSGWDNFVDSGEAVAELSPESLAAIAQDSVPPLPTAATDDWQTVDFPNAISVDAIDRQSLYAADPVNATESAPPTVAASTVAASTVRVEDIPDASTQPKIEELVSLIQELNQCNNALLDRVSQLEEALEQSQRAQQSQPGWAIAAASEESLPTDVATLQERLISLQNEFEFAQQTAKRQQILVETLTGQLDSSQERVAQLERECAQIQQRYTEQTQLLAQSDVACRDLHARLQRQQRYTLQFKAALEKCLEVPPPSYESLGQDNRSAAGAAFAYDPPSAIGQMLLPKVQRIQPWSSQSHSKFIEKFNGGLLSDGSPDIQPLPDSAPPVSDASQWLEPGAIASTETASDALTNLHNLFQNHDQNDADQPSSSEGATLTDLSFLSFVSDDAASAQTHSSQGTTSTFANAAASNTAASAATSNASGLSAEAIQAGIAELQSVFGDFWKTPIATESDSEEPTEQALWHDLARLIDISAEDLVKASLATDFEAFESIHLETEGGATPPDAVGDGLDDPAISHGESRTVPKPSMAIPPVSAAIAPLSDGAAKAAPQTAAATAANAPTSPAVPFANNPNWPSPLVHPLRPAKKLSSIASVNLPNFAQ